MALPPSSVSGDGVGPGKLHTGSNAARGVCDWQSHSRVKRTDLDPDRDQCAVCPGSGQGLLAAPASINAQSGSASPRFPGRRKTPTDRTAGAGVGDSARIATSTAHTPVRIVARGRFFPRCDAMRPGRVRPRAAPLTPRRLTSQSTGLELKPARYGQNVDNAPYASPRPPHSPVARHPAGETNFVGAHSPLAPSAAPPCNDCNMEGFSLRVPVPAQGNDRSAPSAPERRTEQSRSPAAS